MLQAVFAQDHHGTLGIQATVDQALCNVARSVPSFSIGDMTPFTQTAICQFDATGKQRLCGFVFRPVLQTVRQAFGVGL